MSSITISTSGPVIIKWWAKSMQYECVDESENAREAHQEASEGANVDTFPLSPQSV